MEMIFLNKESNRKVRIKVRLSEEESEKLKRCAAACGLSQSAFIRQLCKGKAPKLQPQKEFWELMNALYDAGITINTVSGNMRVLA